MPEIDFQILAVIRRLDDADAQGGPGTPVLAEAVAHPEVCCLDTRVMRATATLRAGLKHVIGALPTRELHRRAIAGTPAVREVVVELEPPGKSAGWEGTLPLRLHVLVWNHAEEAHVGFVPALGIEIAAAKPEELEKLIPEQIRFALRRTKAAASLYRLALLDRVKAVRVESVDVRALVKDPKQAAQELEREAETKPVIEDVGSVMTFGARRTAFEIDPLVSQIAEALTGRNARSVLIVGPSGVGKTAAVRELVRTRDDRGMSGTPFWTTSGSRLVAGMSGFGMWQERTGRLVKEAAKSGAVLHIGSLIELMEVGRSTMNAQGIASFLRPYIGRGDVRVIAECTPEQLPVIEREDPHLLAAFRQIKAEEPTREIGRRILRGVASLHMRALENELPTDDAALDVLDRLHRRYAGYSAQPGRPIRFLNNLLRDRADRAAELRRKPEAVSAEDVTAAFARETGLPRFMLDEAVPLDLERARAWFAERVIGQTEAVESVVALLATVKAALNRPRRPIASVLFIGPTGVGKTEMAKTLAEFFFSDKSRVSRFDMSEYAGPAAVARLVGGAFGTEGLLTAKVREQPFSVILLDEFEKADPSLFDLMLQVLGEGRLTDAAGRVADFSNAIVIMTSNLGAESFQRGSFGLVKSDAAQDGAGAKRHFVEAVRDFFRPELFNRIDRVVPFAPLDRATIAAVTRRELSLVARRDGVKLRGVELDVSEAVVAHLAARGFDARYGARPLKRAIERELLVPLSDALNTYAEQVRLAACVDVRGGKLDVTVRAKREASGRQTSALASGSTSAELATRASALRRRVQRMERSGAVLALQNEIFRLQQTDFRQRRRLRKSPHLAHDPVRAARLKRLTGVADVLARVTARAVAIEDELLHAIYDGDAPASPAVAVIEELDKLEREKDELPLALYALRYDDPDEITLAVYCEHPRPMLRLARAYHDVTRRLDGEVKLWWFKRKEPEKPTEEKFRDKSKERKKPPKADAEEARGHADDAGEAKPVKGAVKLERLDVPDNAVASFLDAHHPDLVGMVIRMRCPNALPRLQDEPGLHVVKDTGGEATCLVELVDAGPIEKYKPPRGAGTRGWIVPGVAVRTYDLKNRRLEDPAYGKLDYLNRSLDDLLLEFINGRLTRIVWEAMDE